jgi:hypothetical protein
MFRKHMPCNEREACLVMLISINFRKRNTTRDKEDLFNMKSSKPLTTFIILNVHSSY